MQSHTDDKIIILDTAIERLRSNDPKWDTLILRNVSFNSTHDIRDEMRLISHITDNGLVELAEAIKQNITLTRVVIDGHNSRHSLEWTATGVKAMGRAMKNHPKLQSLSIQLFTSIIPNNGVIGFFDALTGSAPLFSLSLTGDYFNSEFINSQFISELGNFLFQNVTLKAISIKRENGVPLAFDSLENFIAGLVFRKSIEQLHFWGLKLDDVGIACLESHFSKTTTLISLTLRDVGLSATGMQNLVPLLIANRNLVKLDLQCNPLKEEGISQLALALPSLIFLKELDVSDTQLDDGAIDYLVKQWRELKLGISTLSLQSNRFTEHANKITNKSLISIHKLIDGNVYLKNLRLAWSAISDYHIQVLAPLLIDRQRCHLENFSFSGLLGEREELSKKSYSKIVDILKRNAFITIDPPSSLYYSMARIQGNRKNADYITMKHQQSALNQLIEIGNIYTAPSKSQTRHFSMLPLDAVLIIAAMLNGTHIGNMNVVRCSQLILYNFALRRALMNEDKYTPPMKQSAAAKKEIAKWWRRSIKDDTENRRALFKRNPNAALFYHNAHVYKEPQEVKPLPTQSNCSIM